MCGGGIVKELFTPVTDLALAATGQEWAIPLANAAESKAQGNSWGTSLAAGGEALAGQEIAGAFGIGSGNAALNSALGIDISPSATGLPNIGKGLGDLFGTGGSGGNASTANGTPVQGSSAGVSSTPSAAAGGGVGGGAGAIAAPGGESTLPWQDSSISPSLSGAAQSTGSSLTSSSNVGSGTVGTQSLSSGNTPISTDTLGSGGDLASKFTAANNSLVDVPVSGPGGAGGGSSVSNFLSHPGVGTAWDAIKANPGSAISAAGLGVDALKGGKVTAQEKALKQEANQLGTQGSQLGGYLQSGTLPPGLQAGINQATEAAKATVRSQYAARGMSGSSAEQQELSAIDSRAQAQGAEMAMQLLNTGINETGMAAGLYQQILAQQEKQDAGLQSAISNFASSMAGSGGAKGGITVNYSGNA